MCLIFACIFLLFLDFRNSISIFLFFFYFFPKQNGPANSTSLRFKIIPKCPINFCNPRPENRAKKQRQRFSNIFFNNFSNTFVQNLCYPKTFFNYMYSIFYKNYSNFFTEKLFKNFSNFFTEKLFKLFFLKNRYADQKRHFYHKQSKFYNYKIIQP